MFDDKTILLTGGTGSFGKRFTEIMLKKYTPKVLRIFSRDELKQWEMQKQLNGTNKHVRFFLGDIRDKERLHRAMEGVDILVHAAALKQVPACEYNPFEAVKTNIFGAQNIIDVAIDHNVEKVMALSTDKAVSPINLYGATKLCMEKLFVAANSYAGQKRTRMSCVRYGNVLGSRGSVIPLFKEQKAGGTITITHKDMARYWLTLDQAVEFVIKCINDMEGGEIFIPKIPSMRILDMAKIIGPDCKIEFNGIRPGEKIHECLLTDSEARHTKEFEDYFIIEPEFSFWNGSKKRNGKTLPEDFTCVSNRNNHWLTEKELQEMIEVV